MSNPTIPAYGSSLPTATHVPTIPPNNGVSAVSTTVPSSTTTPSSFTVLNNNMSQPRMVSEACFELLHLEIVNYVRRTMKQQFLLKNKNQPLSAEDNKLLFKKMQQKLESIGYHTGIRLAERFTRDLGWIGDNLDLVKYLCKDFWQLLWKKQVDKLQTNYKGIYVLHDTSFKWLTKVHTNQLDLDHHTYIEQTKLYVSISCGIIRGALHNLGMNATVKCDVSKPPAVQFTIVDVDKNRANQNTTITTTTPNPTTAPATNTANVTTNINTTTAQIPTTRPAAQTVTTR